VMRVVLRPGAAGGEIAGVSRDGVSDGRRPRGSRRTTSREGKPPTASDHPQKPRPSGAPLDISSEAARLFCQPFTLEKLNPR
jgi:hypothetical protein